MIGLSFAGGLSLLAADRRLITRPKIGFVLAIGAHDDMGRVARFFAANIIAKPDGTETPFQAHEYGVLVLAYSHLEDFFSPQDVPIAREALAAMAVGAAGGHQTAASLSPEGKHEMDELLHHRDLLQEALLQEITLHEDEMDAVSPHGHMAQLRTPVFLLHGAGDTVIPASETLWLAKDVPPSDVKAVLVSPALVHVNMDAQGNVAGAMATGGLHVAGAGSHGQIAGHPLCNQIRHTLSCIFSGANLASINSAWLCCHNCGRLPTCDRPPSVQASS